MKKYSWLVIIMLVIQIIFLSSCNSSTENNNKATENSKMDTYIIFFSEDIGTVEKIKSKGNELIILPNKPVRSGFYFCGWFFDDKLFLEEFSNLSLVNDTLKEDIKVYAKWITENEFKLIGLNEEKLKIEYEMEIAFIECDYNLAMKNIAYNDFIEKRDMYWYATIDMIRVYRTGIGYIYVEDPADIQVKAMCKIASEDAEEYYYVCLSIYEAALELCNAYSSNYLTLLFEIDALSN